MRSDVTTARRSSTLLHALIGLVGLAGCAADPTELVVVVESNLDVPAELDSVRLVVTGPSAVTTSTVQTVGGPDDPTFPLTLSVVPDGENLGPVRIAAVGSLGDVEIIRDEARTMLTAGASKMLRLFLLRGCIERPCGTNEACGEDGCHPIDVAGGSLSPFPGEAPLWTADDACQSNPWDEDGDGQGAEACGGSDCDDQEALSYAGAPESCDGVDNDCDATTDEDCDCEMGSVEDCATVCGSAGSRSCRDDGTWGECAAAEVCNGADDDCDGVSDEGFDYGHDTPTQLSAGSLRNSDPFLSHENGRYAMVWTRRDGDKNIYYGTLGADRQFNAPPVQVGSDANDPQMAFSGSHYGVAWWDSDACGTGCTTRRIYFTTIDESGTVRSRTTQLENGADDRPNPRVVWNGTHFAVSYASGELYIQLIDAAGSMDGEPINIENRQGPADLLFEDGAYTVLFTRDRDVFYNRGTAGAFLSPSRLVHSASDDVQYAAFEAVPEGYLAAWSSDGGRRPEVVVLDAEGRQRGAPVPIGGDPDISFNAQSRPAMTSSDGQVFVVVRLQLAGRNDELYMMRYAPDGMVLQDLTPIAAGPSDQVEPSIAWDGDRLGIAYIDDQTGTDELWFTSVGCQ